MSPSNRHALVIRHNPVLRANPHRLHLGQVYPMVAMTAAGGDGAPKRHAPGFPNDGQWTVRSEGLRPMP